jgi:hypothetical protein
MDTKLTEMVARLEEANPGNIVSVILYGAAVAASGNAKPADYQLLIVAETLALPELKRMNSALKWWETNGFPRATCFTKTEFEQSLDVFPVEFRHIQRAYRILSGEDLLAGVAISNANLRLLTEYELRGKFLRLRALYLPASDDSQRLNQLMTDSVVSFVRFFRAVLEILDQEPPLSRLATVRRIGEMLKIDVGPLERVLRMRHEPANLFGIESQDLFESYLNCLERIIEAVDRI